MDGLRVVMQSTMDCGDGFGDLEPFECACCGNCCRGEGYVVLSPAQVASAAACLGVSVADFLAVYTRPPEIAAHAERGDVWLRDMPGPGKECIMLENGLCRIHAAKPEMCRRFPLSWRTRDIMDYCRGMQPRPRGGRD